MPDEITKRNVEANSNKRRAERSQKMTHLLPNDNGRVNRHKKEREDEGSQKIPYFMHADVSKGNVESPCDRPAICGMHRSVHRLPRHVDQLSSTAALAL